MLAPTFAEADADGDAPWAIKVENGYAMDNIDSQFYYGALVTGFKGQSSRGVLEGPASTIAGVGLLTDPLDKTVPPVVQWGAAQTITVVCVDPVTKAVNATSNCISKWSATSVTVLVPLKAAITLDSTTSGGGKVAVSVNGSAALSSMDSNYYYGALVTGMKPL